MMNKKEIRVYVREQFSMLASEEREKRGREIHGELFGQSFWKQARIVAVTVDTYQEIPTRPIIEKAWREGKTIVVPKVDRERHQLDFYTLTSFLHLENGNHGLQEPMPSKCEQIAKENIDFVIVPGLAFNRAGYRIGFGGGYYDRFLENYQGKTAALAFSFQLFPSLPIETHDLPVHHLVTEQA
ncbi:5-formyltetrahydrofolate cyclo-ligase [Salicibibacter halophilus]|uniref:5-formyltetrahydrofolate cyclo-ligase n=1 Tax=Salicibibacter halophilus TaxID=2502791 RepID=A0A514LD90_9BACI|nr:5-formyltetrahydrofolate cyclo-ligase [Salicibibacter halophilus]QDI89822.1 5-formyltetrahydrofolate cyclo-ligase [Salicibibacter halophilus]